jgi:hypothetical protein
VCKLGDRIAWSPTDSGRTTFAHSLEQASSMLSGYLTHTEYVDLHGWVFTPSSFSLAMSDLSSMGLVGMHELNHFDTDGSEFYFSYGPGQGPPVDRLALCKDILREIVNERLS